MCGIAGCVVRPGQVPDQAALQRMAEALTARGPDASGIAIWENVGLVSTRLAIVDPGPAGAQPMSDPDERWLVVYNGETYNHLELRTEVGSDGWRGHSDTETVARALATWDAGAVERFNGPLALPAVDRLERRLLLARDRFGKKPLYLARHNGTLWFASEMRALIAAGLPVQPRVEILRHIIARAWAYGSSTPIAGFERLLPGSTRTVDLRTLETRDERWYEPPDSVDPELAAELESLPRRELVERLHESLRIAVRRRLMADVPVGTMLSGGVDSSLVTAMAREGHPSLVAFTCSLPDEGRADEGGRAARAARALGVELETVEVDAERWRATLVEAVHLHEYPLAGPSSVPISLIGARATERGVKVLLTGEGADELFAGYPILHRDELSAFLPWHVRTRRDAWALAHGSRATLRRLLATAGLARDPRTRPEPAAEVADFLDQVEGRAAAACAHHDGARARLETMLLRGLSVAAFPHLLNRMDKNAMGSSVETRLPFLDPDFVRLAVNLPLEARTLPRPKGILRDIARAHLPRRVAHRTKQGGMGFDSARRIVEAANPAFLGDGILREVLGVARESWPAFVERATTEFGARGWTSIWTGEIWCRLFLERKTVGEVEDELWRRPLRRE